MQDNDDITQHIQLPEDENMRRAQHFLLGMRPIRIVYLDDMPLGAISPDFDTKEWVSDINWINIVEESFEVKKISYEEFCNECLKIGVNPLPAYKERRLTSD